MTHDGSPSPTGTSHTSDDHDQTDSEAFRDQLLRDHDQWWEFLDASEGDDAPPPTATMDTESTDDRRTPDSTPRSSSRSFQCQHCRAHNPTDATFCFFCGAEPSDRLGYQRMVIVVEDIPDPRLRNRIAHLLDRADEPLDTEEVKQLLDDPPAYLFVDGPPAQIEAMLERLGHLGLEARGTTLSAAGLGWYRELAESIVRHPAWLGATAAVLIATVLLWTWWSLLAVPAGALAFGWLLREHAKWYRSHFRLRADNVLEQLAGFEPSAANRTRQLLAELRDDDVHKSLSVCVMEYYAVWRTIHTSESLNGPVTRRLRNHLGDFLEHLLDACETFDRIDRFLDRDEDAFADDVQSPSISEEKRTELHQALVGCRRRLLALTSSIESLRAKLLSIDVGANTEQTDVKLQGLLEDLDTEARVLEETLDELALDIR